MKAKKNIIISKASVRSTVHRYVHLDYIGFKILDQNGNVVGDLRIAGLFTSKAYSSSVKEIPILSNKLSVLMGELNIVNSSHLGKFVVNFIENYPRDELYQINSSET